MALAVEHDFYSQIIGVHQKSELGALLGLFITFNFLFVGLCCTRYLVRVLSSPCTGMCHLDVPSGPAGVAAVLLELFFMAILLHKIYLHSTPNAATG